MPRRESSRIRVLRWTVFVIVVGMIAGASTAHAHRGHKRRVAGPKAKKPAKATPPPVSDAGPQKGRQKTSDGSPAAKAPAPASSSAASAPASASPAPTHAKKGGWWERIGMFHPALVHMPIAYLLLLILLEILISLTGGAGSRWEPGGRYLAVLTVLSFLPAIATGLLQAPAETAARAELVLSHRNLMLATAALSALAMALRLPQRLRRTRGGRGAYLALLVGAAAVLTIGADLGGKLVYGYGLFG